MPVQTKVNADLKMGGLQKARMLTIQSVSSEEWEYYDEEEEEE